MLAKRLLAWGLIGLAVGVCDAQAQSGEASRPKRDCFFSDQFEGWRAPNPTTIYIRVRSERYYRLDLAGACPKLQSPGAHLITNGRGKRTICTPLDWDVTVSEQNGGPLEQCIVKSMTRLTSAEVATI